MTIRSKLLTGYGAALAVSIVIGASSLHALLSWRESADTLARISTQKAVAERTRSELVSLISSALGFAGGEPEREAAFWRTDKRINVLLQNLLDSAQTEIERDHIQGLLETHDELIWIMRGTLQDMTSSNLPSNEQITSALLRLDEIAEEVTDDVDVLNQFYRDEAAAALAFANSATTSTTYIVVGVGIASTLTLLLAALLMRRWLSAPILGITKATAAISSGDFTVKAPEVSHDEWGELGRDINQMAESLRKFEERLRDQERLAALGEVAAYAAHNIRNPLAGVRAAAQVLQVELPQTESGSRASLAEMIVSIDRLDVWVQRMMTFARPLDFQPLPTDINATIETTVKLSRSAIDEKRIELEFEMSQGLPLIPADASLLEQAYSAIINNAIDAVGESGRISIESGIPKTDNGDAVLRVTFRDNGPGVAENMRDKLFRLFASGKDSGSGLGLAQAKRIFEAHNGTIRIESAQESGCTVITQLPVPRDSANSINFN